MSEYLTADEQDAKIEFHMDPYRVFREDAKSLARAILLASEISDTKLKELQILSKKLIPKLGYVPPGTEF